MEDYGETHKFTQLVPDLQGTHPDEAFSRVPYERGSALLYYIETLIGGAGQSSSYITNRQLLPYGSCDL